MKIDNALRLAGQSFEVERGEESFEVTAIRDDNKKQLQLRPDAGVERGDRLKNKLTDNLLHVLDTDVVVVRGAPYALLADYKTEAELEAEREPRAPQSTIYNIQKAIGSNIGVHGHAEIRATFTFGDLEEEVEQRAEGEERAELLRMMREIRGLLEDGQSLEPGILEEYSEQIDRHSWITSPLATIILTYLITGQFS